MNSGGGMVLIHPPVAKAAEAPGGPARLAASLRRHGVACQFWDANLEGQLRMMGEGGRVAAVSPGDPAGKRLQKGASRDAPAGKGDSACSTAAGLDTWTRRAAAHLTDNLASLRSWEGYRNPYRYRRAVTDVNRLLAEAARPSGVRLSLVDYEDERLSPVRSADLLQAARIPETSPFYPWFCKRLPEILEEGPLACVGFSLNYLSQALTSFSMIGFLRREYPRLRIFLGGGLVTSWMRRPGWRNPFAELADGLVSGPGEKPLLALFGKSRDGEPDRPDLTGFPLPDYLAPGIILPYSAASGCWWRRCSFCPEQAEGNVYRPLPVAQVTADLRALTAERKPALIHLLDNALSPEILDALVLAPPGTPWYGFSRITPHLADPGFCMQLRDSGCVMLQLGLESGDPDVLNALGKGIDLPTVSAALRNLKKAGIAAYVYLLFGTPAETQEAARRTLSFTADHAEEIGFLNLAVFNLPAWGPEAEGLATGEFYGGDLSFYRSFCHPRGWNRPEVRRFLQNEFKRHPDVAAIVRRDPPFFTSNHAPFLAMACSS
jgi:hypothetical protein